MTEMQMLLCEAQFSANIEHRLWQEVDDLRAQGLDVAETWEQLGEQIERIAKRKHAIIGELREYLDSGWLKIPVQIESPAISPPTRGWCFSHWSITKQKESR